MDHIRYSPSLEAKLMGDYTVSNLWASDAKKSNFGIVQTPKGIIVSPCSLQPPPSPPPPLPPQCISSRRTSSNCFQKKLVSVLRLQLLACFMNFHGNQSGFRSSEGYRITWVGVDVLNSILGPSCPQSLVLACTGQVSHMIVP